MRPTPSMRRIGWAPTARRAALEAVTLAPMLAAGLGLARLTNAPTAPKVLIPIVACVVSGSAAAALTHRWRGWLGTLVPLVGGALVVSLVSAWWFVGASTVGGLPTVHTVHALGQLLSSAFAVIEAVPTPLPATSGVVLCIAAGAGLLAACARALLPADVGSAPDGAVGLALAPSAGLFAYSALVSSGSDRVQATVAFLMAVGLYVVTTDRVRRSRLEGAARSASLAPSARQVRRAAAVLAVGAMAVGGAVVVPLAVSPALAGMQLHALQSSGPAGNGEGSKANGEAAIAGDTLALEDDLDGVPTAGQSGVLFVARSSEPTYWQVATLDSFDGLSWDPEPAALEAAGGIWPVPASSLPVLEQPTTGPTLRASITVEHLQGSLVPVPPDTRSIRGRGLTTEPGIGVDVRTGARPGATYSLVALTGSPSSSDGGVLSAVAPADLVPYLQMTPQPQEVVALAHRIVAGATTPLAEALALARFFDDGKFKYSLTAPNGGSDALEQFLFHTRAGICQQFAGAYAVLARIDGLPTRIAVGFDAGTPVAPGVYKMTAADAHVWPEVYLGPALGWVSFEPTPLTAASTVADGVLYGTPGVAGSGPPAAGVFENPRLARHSGVGSSAPSPTSSVPVSPQKLAARSSPSGDDGSLWWLFIGLALVAAALVLSRHRLRVSFGTHRSRTASASAAVTRRWQQAERALGRRGLGRGPAETMAEHASRVGAVLRAGAGSGRAGRTRTSEAGQAFGELAALASRVGFSGHGVSPAEVDTARRLGARVRAGLGRRLVSPSSPGRR